MSALTQTVSLEKLQQFPFQVAGHGALLKVPGGKICKPLIPRELWFYESLDKNPELRGFVAPFHGTLDLEISKEQLGGMLEELEKQEQKCAELEKDSTTNCTISDRATEVLNPWGTKVTKENFEKMLAKGLPVFKYLVLDDLTFNYTRPSICDIKIGTRQYGDDATDDKKRRHTKKVESTTSKDVGVRICGQMVYQPASSSYRHFDKYQGRKLDLTTLQPTVAEFFFDGSRFRTDELKQFVDKLQELIEVLQDLETTYRIYSASLLLIYEGNPEDGKFNIDLRMVDFAHTFPFEEGNVQDDGYVFGLKNLKKLLVVSLKEFEEKQLSSTTSTSKETIA